jgi:hypothetical protein
MRHGIDLKTHSQCQRSAAALPGLRQAGSAFVSSIGNLMCHSKWLPGGAYRDRTDDPLLAKQVLSQLS